MRTVVTLIGILAGGIAAAAPPDHGPAVELGPWLCIGPFKDAAFGIAQTSFDTPFPPELDVLQAGGGAIDRAKTYEAPKFPGMLDTQRRWQPHPEWIDGYRHLLPRGPAPSRNESVYLLRTHPCRARRSPWRRSTARKTSSACGSMARQVAEFDCRREVLWLRRGRPRAFRSSCRCRPGENRLLVKHTSLHNAHGFAFNIPRLSGLAGPDEKDIAAVVASTANRFTSFDGPSLARRTAVRRGGSRRRA